jgi:hypothetical protein
MKIQRERWVLIRDNEKIFCGRAKAYEFRAIEDLRDIAVTTYLSKNKAIASFIRSWWRGKELIESGEVKAVKVIETFETVKELQNG